MLKNLWYAVEFSQAIVNKPQLVQIFDRQIVIYRDTQGILHALDNTCPHRGASLANGNVQENCIVCPYHGWHFQGDGNCVKIPANAPKAVIPKQALAKTYPVQEKDGWVWIFWGDEGSLDGDKLNNFPIPAIPQSHDPKFRLIYGDFRWQVNYERAIDNGLDFAHAPFVHAGAFGNPDAPEIAPLEIETYEWGASATVLLEPNPPKGLWSFLAKKDPDPVKTRTGFLLPNLTFLEVQLPFGTLVIWTAHVPINANTTVSKWMNFRSFFPGKWADGDARKRTLKIFEQDRPIVEAQYPQHLPIDSTTEIFVAADLLQLKYRELCNKLST
jgi:phenylpropionate dioxygenase-like ring-hydroxylating dioxygenase large terminal subunit